MLVFTGGDPLMRPDVYDIAEYAVKKGVRVSMTPSATPNVTKETIQKAKEVGLARWAFSLDGPTGRIDGLGRAPKGVNDGNGFVFISHIGDVYPSGLLPIKTGNIRTTALAEIYRNSPVFQNLRNPDKYKGKCGVCEFRYVCGGSRSRAYAMTGDYMESEPFCVYIPKALRKQKKNVKTGNK